LWIGAWESARAKIIQLPQTPTPTQHGTNGTIQQTSNNDHEWCSRWCGIAVVLPLLFALVVRVRLPLPLRVSLALLLGQIDAGRLLDDSL